MYNDGQPYWDELSLLGDVAILFDIESALQICVERSPAPELLLSQCNVLILDGYPPSQVAMSDLFISPMILWVARPKRGGQASNDCNMIVWVNDSASRVGVLPMTNLEQATSLKSCVSKNSQMADPQERMAYRSQALIFPPDLSLSLVVHPFTYNSLLPQLQAVIPRFISGGSISTYALSDGNGRFLVFACDCAGVMVEPIWCAGTYRVGMRSAQRLMKQTAVYAVVVQENECGHPSCSVDVTFSTQNDKVARRQKRPRDGSGSLQEQKRQCASLLV